MTNKKISDFTSETTPANTALFEIETAAGNSRKSTLLQVGNVLRGSVVAGANITLTPDNTAGTLTIASSGGGGGGGYEKGVPTVDTAASFTAVNPGTGTFTDGTSALINAPQLNGNFATYVKTTPAAPFSVYCRISTVFLQNSFSTSGQSICGIALRNGGGANNQLLIGIEHFKGASDVAPAFYTSIIRVNSAGGFVSRAVYRLVPNEIIWFKADVTSTTVTMFVSFDGQNWISVGSETLATHITAITQYGVGFYGVSTNNNQTSVVRYLSTTAP